MEESKILVLAILILFIATLTFGFGDLTGQAIKEKATKISVEPQTIMAGDSITATIIPGSKGVSKYLLFYDGTVRKGQTGRLCTGNFRCYEPVTLNYQTSREWQPGIYSAAVFDYFRSEYVKAYFTVEKYKPI